MAIARERTNPVKIHGTTFTNTPEGVAAFANEVRQMAVARERDRRAANDRRDRGDYGIELSAAHAALQSIREGKAAEYPADTLDDTWDAVTRAMVYGFDGSGYIADQIDASVDALNTYASDLANELIKLAEAAYTIRHGRESTDS
jgi:hypothetical protein